MAVDTRERRFSMMNLGRMPMINLFEADGAVDADDKAHMLSLYGGIPLDNPAATSGQLLSIRHVRNFNIGISGGFK